MLSAQKYDTPFYKKEMEYQKSWLDFYKGRHNLQQQRGTRVAAKREAHVQNLQGQMATRVAAKREAHKQSLKLENTRRFKELKWKEKKDALQKQQQDRVAAKHDRREQEYDKMPWDAMGMGGDPCAWRYFDYPRPGSIYRLLDIPSLVRGPTVVLMPSGREVQVPAQVKHMVSSPAEIFDVRDSQSKMSKLIKLLSAKQGPSAPAGYKFGQAPAFQTARNHPREQLRTSSHGRHTLAF